MRRTALAIAGILMVGSLVVPARAQPRAASQDNSPDVKALIFDLANSMGMLRGLQQEDSIITLEHWATGTATIGQQRFELPEYRLSVNYTVPGMRVDFVRKRPDGQTMRQIEVVSGPAAWNEAERGRNSTAAHDRVKERLVQLWTTPMGLVKAARAAGAKAMVTTQGGASLLSFPLPAPVDDIIVNATVRKDASLLVKPHPSALKGLVGTYIVTVITAGAIVSETTYAEYGDWNWDDYRADIMLPGRITRRQGDATFELKTTNTNTYNPYVVMPVPENLKQQTASK